VRSFSGSAAEVLFGTDAADPQARVHRRLSAGINRSDRAHPILVMQVHLPRIDDDCMDTASAPPACASMAPSHASTQITTTR
jgi:hypothetical protein